MIDRKELYQYIQKKQPNICQISVLQNGNEVCSAEWNGYQRTDCTHIMSATKSVVSLLIAIDQGISGSVDDFPKGTALFTFIFAHWWLIFPINDGVLVK